MTTPPDGGRSSRLASAAFWLTAAAFGGIAGHYYLTGGDGPMRLAVMLVPLAVALVTLHDARQGTLYPALRPDVALGLGLMTGTAAVAASAWLLWQFDAIRVERVGIWSLPDLLAGGAVALLILEITRRKYFALFVVNLALMAYAVFGAWVPGIFGHPGIGWQRVVSATSLEMSTGVFDRLAQLGLTLIGAFILVLAALRAFGCIDAILRGAGRLASRRPAWLPQSAVAGSFAVAAVSGSGAANAATTGAATIPALIRAGFPRVQAAAVETAASIGGQLMPPLMGIAAFMMAELMGVSYFDVVARGFAPALIYFVGVSLAVWWLARRYRPQAAEMPVAAMHATDWARLAAYALAVAGLIVLMGVQRMAAMNAALLVFSGLCIWLGTAHLWQLHSQGTLRVRSALQPLPRLLDTFAVTTSELTVLLATLGILTALFTVTGVPDKVGVLLMEAAAVHIVVMVLAAFAFGYLVGMGLPVAPTYIVVAVVVTPFMIRAGIDPWVAHFFAFFVAVFGELSPPTSVTAAVTSRIAEAPFVRTMFAALALCLPLPILAFAIFPQPALVVAAGAPQLGALALVLAATVMLTAAVHAATGWWRMALLAAAGATLAVPDALLAAGIVAVTIAVAWLRHVTSSAAS